MAKATVIPFGPQHPVLPEPLHLDLVCEDERVVEVIPQIGFIHRGLEKLTEKRAKNILNSSKEEKTQMMGALGLEPDATFEEVVAALSGS